MQHRKVIIREAAESDAVGVCRMDVRLHYFFWFGGRKGIQPVKKLSGGVLVWLVAPPGRKLHTTNTLQGRRAKSHVDTQTIQPGLGDFVL